MAELNDQLWKYNLAKVRIVDVTDDYRLMQPPLPSQYYPVLKEIWLPRHNLGSKITAEDLAPGYLYDWHELPGDDEGDWYVGVVDEALMKDPVFQARFGAEG